MAKTKPAFRMISNPTDITPVFVVDDITGLEAIAADGHYDEQGTTALVLATADVYMVDSNKKWVKL